MRTGSSRPYRRPAQVFVAVFSALSLVSVVGCADNSPVAAPTSTLPAQQSDGGATDDPTEVAIPDYETDLDLDQEEKKAVEGALVAFVGYFQTVNKAYSGDFAAADEFPEYADGEALKSVNGDVEVIKDGSYRFTGDVTPSNIEIEKVESEAGSVSPTAVTVHFCFDLSKWSLLPKDESQTPNSDELVTMEHNIYKESGNWKVTEQTLRERKC
ncbi:hypothetical protein [Brevibacterium sp. 'Marine']|uniref:hypothetical protein n=1 Tax=Brevibacterium sp. 'Marine' TaxID=2725563 RepID=UPI00145FA9C7|nr:hypothetical protein [Brevibacterium sp. 'Marine']